MTQRTDVRGGRKYSLSVQTLYVSAACFAGVIFAATRNPVIAGDLERILGHLATIVSVSVFAFHGANGLEGTFGNKLTSKVTSSMEVKTEEPS